MAALAATPSIGSTATNSRASSRTKWTRPMAMRRSQTHIPSTSASIPSRYQTFFYSSTENKGFNSQASRFAEHLNVNENPGPADYTTQPDSFEKFSSSFSKQGAGGLASKKIRFARQKVEKVGPASYFPQSTASRQDFSRADTSSNFCKPIVHKTAGVQILAPAPNTYQVSTSLTERNNLITAKAAFDSKTPRKSMTLYSTNTPAPSQYDVSEKLVHPSSCSYESAFKSKSIRRLKAPQKGPGPADYFTDEDRESKDTKAPYHRHKHYLCFSAPALPLPPLPPPPGPGHYEIMGKMSIGNEKAAALSGAVFKSITGRGLNGAVSRKLEPGPGYYDPVDSIKKSYYYNIHKKWV